MLVLAASVSVQSQLQDIHHMDKHARASGCIHVLEARRRLCPFVSTLFIVGGGGGGGGVRVPIWVRVIEIVYALSSADI